MKKLINCLCAIFEFMFFTFLMICIDSIEIPNLIVEIIVHFLGFIVTSFLLYLLFSFILKKLKMFDSKRIYMISVWNLGLGLLVPIILSILIPSIQIRNFSTFVLFSTFYYGLLTNFCLIVFNFTLTKL